jgi:hypothetical protein
MAVTSSRTVQIQFSGDITLGIIQSALDNAVSPGMEVIQSLSSGNNTITAPVVSGIVVTSLTIIPPSGNTILMTIKGVNGDTGIPLHKTDPTTIALDTTFVSCVINAASAITGVRLIWT